ncbi:F-box/kelch-repeat protein [Cardamine amara subsp. amara]|uniref:F-box/kelch-repeat protein n=1 Tax=Cardamine amara subsp. amara TaxID=228776 RepID=A0ABD1AJB8_CARAN
MSSPEKKRKPPTRNSPESNPIPSLPYDLVLSCLARVSKLHYPTLSLVSKTFQSLIASPELYKTRSFLNRTESSLYICLEFPSDPTPRWFTLYQKPNQTLTKEKKKKSSGYVLIPLSIPNSPPTQYDRGILAVGSNIYAIGGSNKCGTEYVNSTNVSILDCRSHMWHDAPSMRMKRINPAGNVVDGKLYVAGGCEDFDSSNWMEVFDLKTQTWELVLSPFAKRCKSHIYKSSVVDGEIYIFGDKGVVYKPKEDRWEMLEENQSLDLGWGLLCYCVIDNILYSYTYSGGIRYYDTEVRNWMDLNGLGEFPKCAAYAFVKIADYGGKMAVFWDKYLRSSGYKSKTIWCAVISLKRSKTKEVWGKVEWVDVVLTVPHAYKFVDALTAIL